MKDPKEFLNSFPEINDLLQNAAKQVKDIEEQINRLLKDNPPHPHLKPEGSPPIRPEGTRAQNIAILKQRITDVQKGCTEDVEGRIVNVDLEAQLGIRSHMNLTLGLTQEKDKEVNKISNAEKLMEKLTPSKLQKIELLKDNSDTIEKAQTDTSKNLSNTERLMKSLPSLELKKEFKDNNRDITKDMD